MSEPTTEAGRALAAFVRAADAFFAGRVRYGMGKLTDAEMDALTLEFTEARKAIGWPEVVAVEQEARRAVLAELRAEIEGLEALTVTGWVADGKGDVQSDPHRYVHRRQLLAAIDRRLGGSE